ncbi:MAG: hypothetical protein M3Q65_01560, partial [Chloroflexota bacterium]|nr:hypothetical protein [Chloroflexota bacterium]
MGHMTGRRSRPVLWLLLALGLGLAGGCSATPTTPPTTPAAAPTAITPPATATVAPPAPTPTATIAPPTATPPLPTATATPLVPTATATATATPTATIPAGSTTRVPHFETTTCPFRLPAGRVVGQDVSCGYVVAPERHERSDGATLRLAVARFMSRSSTPDPDPIIYLSGGPGGPVEGLVAAFRGPAAENFTATRDFIIF